MEIFRIFTSGIMIVYERQRKGERIPKYFVFDDVLKENICEFRRKASAIKFASSNCNGIGKEV
jgi:hypothetical protein